MAEVDASMGYPAKGFGYRALMLEAGRYVTAVICGRAPILGVPALCFAGDFVGALRPHFFALSAMAAVAGASASGHL